MNPGLIHDNLFDYVYSLIIDLFIFMLKAIYYFAETAILTVLPNRLRKMKVGWVSKWIISRSKKCNFKNQIIEKKVVTWSCDWWIWPGGLTLEKCLERFVMTGADQIKNYCPCVIKGFERLTLVVSSDKKVFGCS